MTNNTMINFQRAAFKKVPRSRPLGQVLRNFCKSAALPNTIINSIARHRITKKGSRSATARVRGDFLVKKYAVPFL